jgi:alpha-D-ribose 1-methylphosphonate 5-triphosphate synthase subunit PhnH
MLDAMARPGKVCPLPALRLHPAQGLSPYAAGLTFTLLDSETGFAVVPDNAAWQHYVSLNTGAVPRPVAVAEFIIANACEQLPQITAARRGSLLSPEQGSTLILMVERLAESGPGLRLSLTGPGVNGRARLAVAGLQPLNLEYVSGLNQEYPLGVDLFLVDAAGNLAAVPRSTALHWEVAC